HDRGRTFRVIQHTLKELGYRIDWRVIDSRGWVPQHRERIFIAGFREATDFSFDEFEEAGRDLGPRLSTILHPEDGSEASEPPYTQGMRARVSDRYTLSDKLWQYL